MNFLGFLAPLLGIIMEWIYKLIPSYGWTLIIFTLLTKNDTDVPAQRQAAEEHGPDVGISAHDAGDTEKMGQ